MKIYIKLFYLTKIEKEFYRIQNISKLLLPIFPCKWEQNMLTSKSNDWKVVQYSNIMALMFNIESNNKKNIGK